MIYTVRKDLLKEVIINDDEEVTFVSDLRMWEEHECLDLISDEIVKDLLAKGTREIESEELRYCLRNKNSDEYMDWICEIIEEKTGIQNYSNLISEFTLDKRLEKLDKCHTAYDVYCFFEEDDLIEMLDCAIANRYYQSTINQIENAIENLRVYTLQKRCLEFEKIDEFVEYLQDAKKEYNESNMDKDNKKFFTMKIDEILKELQELLDFMYT